MEQFSKLTQLVASLEEDFRKFYEKGNNAAGTRIRKGMQDVKKVCQEIRASVQEKKGAE